MHVISFSESQEQMSGFRCVCDIPFGVSGLNVRFLMYMSYAFRRFRNKCQVFDVHVICFSESQEQMSGFRCVCDIPFGVSGLNVRFLMCMSYAFRSLRNKCQVFDVYVIYLSESQD